MKKITYLLILFLPLFSCSQKDNTAGNSSNGQNAANEKRLLDFYAQVINAHNLALVDSFCTQDFLDHQPFPGYPPDLAGLKKGFADMITAFPDINFSVEMVKSWGDTVVAKFRMKGTNSGSFMGTPAGNKPVDVEGVDILVFKDGKAREHWGYSEEMKMMSQMGMGSQQAETESGKEHSEKN